MAKIKFWWGACALVYVLFFFVNAWHAYTYPISNWDLIAYMGAAESYSTKDPDKLYEKTFDRIKQIYSEEGVKNIKANPLSSNARAFHQQLPYYNVKPLYVGTIALLDKLGAPMWKTGYALSVLGFVAFGVLCMLFRPKDIDIGLWMLMVMMFCMIGKWSIVQTIPWTTPDMPCIAVFLVGLWGWVYKRSVVIFAAGVLLAQLIRSDTMMLTLFLLAFFALDPTSPRMPQKLALIVGGSAIALYFLVGHLAGSYGWLNLVEYVFFNRAAYPAEMVVDITVSEYWKILSRGITKMLTEDRRVQILLLLSFLFTYAHYRYPVSGKQCFILLLWVGWASLGARFIMLPAYWEDRYYLANYLVIMYALAEIFGGLWKHRQARLPMVPG